MKTVQATETAVSIWITHEQAPTREQMLRLVRQALADHGLDPWPETEAECFAAGEDTLVIARPAHARRPAFCFGDLEDLLGGAMPCPDGDSSLYAVGEGYVLALGPEEVRPSLYEYGQAGCVTAGWEAHAREQGLCLIRGEAVAVLRRYFAR